MIERDLMTDLLAWKQSGTRQPLVLHGARQVGKTWLLKHLGESQYDQSVYVSFDKDRQAADIFDPDLDVQRIIMSLRAWSGKQITPENTLIIFDEVQECPRALTSLKYFAEDAPQYHVAAAGSLLGLVNHQGTGFPVGKVDVLHLHPCTFAEFLGAVGRQGLQQALTDPQATPEFLSVFHDNLVQLLRQYFVVGGMPRAVAEFSQSQQIQQVRRIQAGILTSYQNDISKHVGVSQMEPIDRVWQMLPTFLSRENKRFVFGEVIPGKRAKDLFGALTWLQQAGLMHMVWQVTKPGMPLAAYQNPKIKAFKGFVLDVGLLGAMTRLDPKAIIGGDDAFTEFKGALVEQFVCQSLAATDPYQASAPYYWSAANSQAEVDFLVQHEAQIYAMEVKAQENLRSQSLRAFRGKYPDVQARRFSLSNWRDQDWLRNIPLYAAPYPNLWV